MPVVIILSHPCCLLPAKETTDKEFEGGVSELSLSRIYLLERGCYYLVRATSQPRPAPLSDDQTEAFAFDTLCAARSPFDKIPAFDLDAVSRQNLWIANVVI